MNRRVASVRGHVLGWLLGASAIGAVLLTLAAYTVLRDEQNETLDANLREVALAVARELGATKPELPLPAADAFDHIVIARWNPGGERIYLSDAAVALQRPDRSGLARQRVGGEAWDAFALIDANGTTVAAQLANAQEARAAESAAGLLLPFLLVIGVVALLLVLALRRGLAPLDDAANALAARSETSLEPLDADSLPRELRPLVRAMNHLMARVARSLEAQQRFIADAAHALRTPVTALRLQQQLVSQAVDGTAREQALVELQAGIERIQHLIAQLLDLSRVDPSAGAGESQPVALDALAAEGVAELTLIAERRGIDLGLQRADAVTVQGDAHQLRVLLDNLVDNALRHTPGGGVVDVSVHADGGGAQLCVADSGPGIVLGERERVFVRFVRGATHNGVPAGTGSGLGLAIVQAIAKRHGARVTLEESRSGGLLARVRFPLATAGESVSAPEGAKGAPV